MKEHPLIAIAMAFCVSHGLRAEPPVDSGGRDAKQVLLLP